MVRTASKKMVAQEVRNVLPKQTQNVGISKHRHPVLQKGKNTLVNARKTLKRSKGLTNLGLASFLNLRIIQGINIALDINLHPL